MTVHSSPAPAMPSQLELKVLPDKSLEIRWVAESGTDGTFELQITYYNLDGPMIKADFSTVVPVNGCAEHMSHPESLAKDQAWVVKVVLRAVTSEGLRSGSVTKQVAWDDELSMKTTQQDLKERIADFQKKDLDSFLKMKGTPEILILGGQHHGKSSFINHVFRCLKGDLTESDQMDHAPAGTQEKTIETKRLDVKVGSSGASIWFVDTPAFANMTAEMCGKLKTLISTCARDGMQRHQLALNEWSMFKRPPHAAVVVMSLCHWRDQPDEMRSYFQKIAEVFENASGGKVVFPYVVAATHRDEFLKDCQKELPAKALQNMVEDIKKYARTEHVYSISNYKQDSVASARNNKVTFDLLSQLLAKANNHNTAKTQKLNQNRLFVMLSVFGVIVAMLVAFVIKMIG